MTFIYKRERQLVAFVEFFHLILSSCFFFFLFTSSCQSHSCWNTETSLLDLSFVSLIGNCWNYWAILLCSWMVYKHTFFRNYWGTKEFLSACQRLGSIGRLRTSRVVLIFWLGIRIYVHQPRSFHVSKRADCYSSWSKPLFTYVYNSN